VSAKVNISAGVQNRLGFLSDDLLLLRVRPHPDEFKHQPFLSLFDTPANRQESQ